MKNPALSGRFFSALPFFPWENNVFIFFLAQPLIRLKRTLPMIEDCYYVVSLFSVGVKTLPRISDIVKN